MNLSFLEDKRIPIDHELALGLPSSGEAIFEFYKAIHDNREHLLPWMDWAMEVTLHKQHALVEKWKEFPKENGFERVLYKAGKPIGACGIRLKGHGFGEIGYWLVKDETGKGIMTRVADFLTRIGFAAYELNRLEIHVAKENEKSCNVARRLGYTHEATLRERHLLSDGYHDLEIFGMLRREWKYGRD